MKKYFLLIAVLSICITSSVRAQNWLTHFESAKQQAAKKKIPIVLVFQGSDWCAPCMRMNKEIWESEDFKSYADEHYVMLKADFPRRKTNKPSQEIQDQNVKLAETYNTKGIFPFVVILDAKGKILGVAGYEKVSPKEYITKLNSFIE